MDIWTSAKTNPIQQARKYMELAILAHEVGDIEGFYRYIRFSCDLMDLHKTRTTKNSC